MGQHSHARSFPVGRGQGQQRLAWEAGLAFTEVCRLAFWALPLLFSPPTSSASFSTIPCHAPESCPLDSFPGGCTRSLLCSSPDSGGALGAGGTPRLWRLCWWEPHHRAATVTAPPASAADSFLNSWKSLRGQRAGRIL